MRLIFPILILAFGPMSWAVGQSSSLFRESQQKRVKQSATTTRPAKNGALRSDAGTTAPPALARNRTLFRYSLTAVRAPEPTVIKPNDLIAIIVRHRFRSRTNARMKQESQWDLASKLDAFFRIHDRKLLQQAFRGGKPEVKFTSQNDLENKVRNDRRDLMETRLMGKVLDVKPNGNLIVVASYTINDGQDTQTLVLNGEINRRDIGPDRNVTSDKIFDLKIRTYAHGAVGDGIKRGWLKELLDNFKAF